MAGKVCTPSFLSSVLRLPYGLAKTISSFCFGGYRKDTATPKWYSFCQNLACHPSPRIKEAYQSSMRLFAELGLVTSKTAYNEQSTIITPDETVMGHSTQQTQHKVKGINRRMGDYRQ